MTKPSTIGGINRLPEAEKRAYYQHIIPPALLAKYAIPDHLIDPQGRDLLQLKAEPGSTQVELALYHHYQALDPVIFGHLTDTLQGQIHILLYGMNDPTARRYHVDRLPDGEKTKFGTGSRNIPEETAALAAGLAPGQVRRGPGLFKETLKQFETFVADLGHKLFFVEPLYYHVAVMFEWHGFAYQNGKSTMKAIDEGFSPGGRLLEKLDGSSPFRRPEAASSIRLRSWAVHDRILGKPFPDLTMYKILDQHAGVSTTDQVKW